MDDAFKIVGKIVSGLNIVSRISDIVIIITQILFMVNYIHDFAILLELTTFFSWTILFFSKIKDIKSNMSKTKLLEYVKNSYITELAVDSHAHLDRFENADEIISRLKDDGLSFVVLMAGNGKSAEWNKRICEDHENLFFMYGYHPFDINEYDENEFLKFIDDNKTNKNLVGVGEIGLDYSRENDDQIKKRQEKVLVSQLSIANKYNLPIAIHIRDAHEDSIRILKENKCLIKNGGIIHCCSANADEVQEYLSLGFYISFSGTITYGKKNAEYYLEESLLNVPLDRLLIETDCPFLCPAPYRGRVNEPKYVLVTAEKIATILGLDINTLIKITRENAKKLLKI